MKEIATMLLALFILPAFGGSVVSGKERKEVLTLVNNLIRAFLKHDYTTTVNGLPDQFFTHLKTDKAAVLTSTTKLMQQFKSMGIKVLSYTSGKIIGSYNCKLSKVVFVQAKMKMSKGTMRTLTESFVVVSRNVNKKKWNAVDGAIFKDRDLLDRLYGCQGIPVVLPKTTVKIL